MVFCYEIVTSYRLVKKANARSGMKHLVTTDIVMMTLVSVMILRRLCLSQIEAIKFGIVPVLTDESIETSS
ncbi:hypothetical protein [Streptococcus dysgalactiae]|uniref:hypothetical protein n=1 Tax=Streptococcus dysgalactiae TaxID=1334 RepID=UPI0010D8919B|nr:hypothetical protein [Streptococcus dysgalactiae]VTS95047.1 Uncharacterised protein [Streptococcus dysgalactiae subsp. equisimilis]